MSGAAHVALLLAVAGAGAGAFQVPAITLTRGCAPALSAPPRAASAVALQAPCRGSSLRLRAQGGGGEEASHGRYCLHVRLQVRAERRDEFLECIQANQRGTLTTEPLALAYLFGEDETSTNTFHFFEAYKGRAGFEAHTQTPHFADWEKFVATDPLSAPPQVQFYSELQVAGDAARLPELSAQHYCLGVCLKVKPERRDEFLECIQANQRGTLTTEPLALAYLFGEDETSTNTFHFFEAYKGRAGFEAHTQTPHFADWEKFVATDPLSAPPQVSLPVHIHACVHTQTHTHTDTHIHTRTHTHAHTHTRAPALTR